MNAPLDEYSGFLFHFDEPERARYIKKLIDRGKSFTDTFSDSDWPLEKREIFLVTSNGILSAIALVTAGRTVATEKRSIKFERLVLIEPAIDLNEVHVQIGQSLNPYIAHASSGAGRRLEGMWSEVLQAIRRLRPSMNSQLDELVAQRLSPTISMEEDGMEVMAMEKDAVNIALRISGINHYALKWVPLPDTEPQPFLSILWSSYSKPIREDQMISHDANVFGDWIRDKAIQAGPISFVNGDQKLTIMNVNRHSLEETTGVDLIYLHHRYSSYIMVQYKRMTRTSKGNWIYRPIDNSYKKEIGRMQNLQEILHNQPKRQMKINDYRLHPSPFHFKLCRSIPDDPASQAMIDGVYVPLDYWTLLLEDEVARGPGGGLNIGEYNLGRNFKSL